MSDLDELINELMKDPVFAAEYKKLKPERWQGLMDSNHRMTESESVALPLGEAPIWQELMESNHRPRIWSPLFSSLN